MRAGCPPRRPPPTRGVRALASSSSPHPPTGCRLTAVELETRLDVAASTRRLDLSECGLTSVPPAVLELTGLEDLSLAGNAIEALPAGLAELPLVRLQLAGNRLTSLPPSLGRLTGLEGLWVHGNALTSLPDGLDGLVSLRTLSAAGNALAALPPSFAGLTALAEAGLAGNALRALPCELEGLVSLAVLKLNGNALAALPPALGALPRLKALALQANPALASLPPSLASAPALADLNAADCGLTSLPDALASAPALATATFYGNRLAALPPALAAAPALERLWLEGNPLAGGPLEQLVVDAGRAAAKQSASSSSSSSRRPLRVGLDDAQAASIPADLLAAAGPAVSVSGRAADAPGYWKLERGGPPSSSSSRRLDVTDARGTRGRRALVVAFGSAPGEPNWGGLLARLAPRARLVPGVPIDCLSPDPALVAAYVADPLNLPGNVRARTANETLKAFRAAAATLAERGGLKSPPVFAIHGDADRCTSMPAAKRVVEGAADGSMVVFEGGYHERFHGATRARATRVCVDWILGRAGAQSKM